MAAPPPVLTLAVEKGPRKGDTRQCAAGSTLRIGRVVKGNHLAVRDVGASQQHLAIEFLPPPAARWAVSDLGSSNGSLLNGAALVPNVPAPLSHGDSIKIGESTVLVVSIPDLDLNAATAAEPEPRRSSRSTAAIEEEKPPAATRRGARKKAAVAEIPEVENEVPDATVVVMEEEKARPATRRGGRGKATVAEETEEVVGLRRHGGRKKVEQPPELEKEEGAKEPPVVTRRGGRKKVEQPPELEKEKGEKEAPVATRRGGRKKAAEPPELEKGDEKEDGPVATHVGGRKKALELAELEKEDDNGKAVVLTRRGGRNKTTEPPEPEKEEEEEEVPVVTRGRRKKNAVTVAPPPQPPKTRSRRGQGRVTGTTSTRSTVLEDEEVEEEEENEVAAPRELPGNLSTSTAVKDGEEEKGDKVAAGDVEIEAAAKILEEEVPKGRGSAQCAASDNVGDEENGGAEEEDDGNGELVGSGGELGDGLKVKHAGSVEIEAAAKTLEEEVPKGRGSAQCAASHNVGDEEKGGGAEEDDGNGELVGNGGELGDGVKMKRAGRSSLETMTLGEWFDRMEIYLPRTINEAADKMIAELEEKQKRIHEYIATLGNNSKPS